MRKQKKKNRSARVIVKDFSAQLDALDPYSSPLKALMEFVEDIEDWARVGGTD